MTNTIPSIVAERNSCLQRDPNRIECCECSSQPANTLLRGAPLSFELELVARRATYDHKKRRTRPVLFLVPAAVTS